MSDTSGANPPEDVFEHPTPTSRRPLPRRALLTGAAAAVGLAVGAGGVQLGHALSSGTTTVPGVGLASPGEELMTEHGVLKRILLAYDAVIERLGTSQRIDTGVVTDAAQIVNDYIEGFHEGLEEAYVFPQVAAADDSLAPLVRTLLVQHDRGRHLTARVLAAAAGDLTQSARRTSLRSDLAAFVRMYEPHEAREDTVIYPALRRAQSERTIGLLAERFADLQNKQYGDNALDQMLSRIVGIEQKLGIDDLESFTPSVR
ncbi:MAG: hemerythrin domain-containing protein [Jatrophihabitans sp.]